MKKNNKTKFSSLSDLLFGKGNQGGFQLKVTNEETVFSLSRKQKSDTLDKSLSDYLFGNNNDGFLGFRKDSANHFSIELLMSSNITFLTANKDQQ